MDELTQLPLAEIAAALRRGEFSSRELTQACLERIERLEPALHAFITLTPELALKQAEEADRRLVAWRKQPDQRPARCWECRWRSRMCCLSAGVRCTCGSRILENFIPPFTATRGRAPAGCRGGDRWARPTPTNLPWAPPPRTPPTASTRNPWDLDRVPGGSSGGSAAAVAAAIGPGWRWAPIPAAACASRLPFAG